MTDDKFSKTWEETAEERAEQYRLAWKAQDEEFWRWYDRATKKQSALETE